MAYAAGMTITLTEAERTYLKSQPLARLATVDTSGAPQSNPVGAFLDERTGDILIGGYAMGATRKFRNVQANGQVALMVDDLVSRDPWTVRGLEIRGTAVALEDVDPPVPFMSREVIRITPTWVTSWGVDPKAPAGAAAAPDGRLGPRSRRPWRGHSPDRRVPLVRVRPHPDPVR